MLPGMGNLGTLMELLRNPGKLRADMERASKQLGEELKNLTGEGSAGGGMVRIRVTGRLEVLECKIDPQVFTEHDAELLEDLIVAATNQALEKIRQGVAEKTDQAMGGLNVPGLADFLGSVGGGSPKA